MHAMKRFSLLLVLALSTSTFGGFIGYYIAQRSQPPPGRDIYLLHEGLDRQARVYMRFLRAQDSAQPEEMTELRRQALDTPCLSSGGRRHAGSWFSVGAH